MAAPEVDPEGLEDEIEILNAMYPGEVTQSRTLVPRDAAAAAAAVEGAEGGSGGMISVPVFTMQARPAGGDEAGLSLVAAAGGVEATIRLVLAPPYPEAPPQIDVTACKGLDDASKATLQERIRERSLGADVIGVPCSFMLFEEGRMVLGSLASSSGAGGAAGGDDGVLDSGSSCLICFNVMSSSDGYVTPCFHGMHSECLARWLWTLHNKKLREAAETGDDMTEAEWSKRMDAAMEAVEARGADLESLEKERGSLTRSVDGAKRTLANDGTGGAGEAAQAAKKIVNSSSTALRKLSEREETARHKLALAESALRSLREQAQAGPAGGVADDVTFDCPSCRQPVPWDSFRLQYETWVEAVGRHEFPDGDGAKASDDDAALQAAIAASTMDDAASGATGGAVGGATGGAGGAGGVSAAHGGGAEESKGGDDDPPKVAGPDID